MGKLVLACPHGPVYWVLVWSSGGQGFPDGLDELCPQRSAGCQAGGPVPRFTERCHLGELNSAEGPFREVSEEHLGKARHDEALENGILSQPNTPQPKATI